MNQGNLSPLPTRPGAQRLEAASLRQLMPPMS
jgi:hypothetical protein